MKRESLLSPAKKVGDRLRDFRNRIPPGAFIYDLHTEGGGAVKKYPKFADYQYRADGVDGPQKMERN